jgi:hypothetical protein
MERPVKQQQNASDLLAIKPTYAPLVPACARYGIGRTKAFELAASGQLSVFKIGQRTFVKLDSLQSLPDRLGAQP